MDRERFKAGKGEYLSIRGIVKSRSVKFGNKQLK